LNEGTASISKFSFTPVSIYGRQSGAGDEVVSEVLARFPEYPSSLLSPIKEWIKNPLAFDVLSTQSGIDSGFGDNDYNESPRDLAMVIGRSYKNGSNPDPITDFNPNTQKIRIDSDPFGISGDYEVDFRIAKSAKQLKKLQKSDFNLIYNHKDGSLYYNVNREEAGFGDRGGLIAVLDPKLPLTGANFEIF